MHLQTWFWRLFAWQATICVALVIAATILASRSASNASLPVSIALLLVIALALSAAATWLSLRRVQQPVLELARLARQISAGDDDAMLAAPPGEELVEISGALQHFRGRLAQRGDQVQQNTERLQTVLASMIEGVLAVSPDHTILLANQAAQRMLDFTSSQPQGRPLLEVTRARAVFEAVRNNEGRRARI